MLDRRTFMAAPVLGALAIPSSSAQQQPLKLPRIGWLIPTGQAEWDSLLEAYRGGMRDLGYVEGRSVETEYLYADGYLERLTDLAAKLLEHKVAEVLVRLISFVFDTMTTNECLRGV